MEPAATGSISVEGPMANEILEGGGMGGWGRGLGGGYFPGGVVVKNLLANAGDTGLITGLGGFHMPQSN